MSRTRFSFARVQAALRRLAGAEREDEADAGSKRPGLIVSVCVSVALVMWITLSLDQTYTVLIELNTRVVNLAPDSALVAVPPTSVQARVRGTGTALFGLKYDRPLVDIDASQDAVVLASVANLPQDVTVEDFFPERINLNIEERIRRRVPIELRAVLEPQATYDFFTDPVLVPDSVDVEGAVSVVSAVQSWPTVFGSHAGLRDSVRIHLPLSDSLGRLVSVEPSHAVLHSTAHRFTEAARILPVLVTDLPTTQPPVELDPGSVEVTYRVALSQYDAALGAEDFYATVPYDDIRVDTTGRVTPRIHMPTELLVRPVETYPRTLAYFIFLGSE